MNFLGACLMVLAALIWAVVWVLLQEPKLPERESAFTPEWTKWWANWYRDHVDPNVSDEEFLARIKKKWKNV